MVNTTFGIIVPENGTVCARSSAPSNCTSLDQLKYMLKRPTAVNGTYAYLAHYMKTFYARELASRGVLTGVTVPGLVDTPGLPAGNVNVDTFCPYPQPWYACNCWSDGDRSYDSSVCPLTPLRGSNSLTFLAAAPTEVLREVNGKMFAACEVQMAPLDQFSSMEESKGAAATLAYARELTALWRQWTGLN
jgi:hypothetical protein